MASIRENIILNGINTVTGIIFPVITFPYAARILLPEGIGAINFLNSIIQYIILFTSIGIPLYAVKEIAKYRDEPEKRDSITIEIFILSSILCLLGYLVVWILAEYVPQIHKQQSLFYILSLSIIFNSIGVNWFYQGIEDFKFITIRGIIIRIISACILFVFVKKPEDLLIYGFIIVGSTVGNNIINFIHLRNYIRLPRIKFRNIRIFKHLKPSFHVFILNLIISLYVLLNSIMLGFMSGDTQVGYFTAGTKISHIGLTLISSLSTVLLPRSSNLLKKGEKEKFSSLINKSLNLILCLTLPMTAGLIILAAPLTMIFCGREYINSIPVLYLNAPVIIFIALTNLMGIQILYPKDKINIVIISVSVAAVLNVILNLILIPPFGANGAALSTLISEFSVLIVQIIGGKRYYPFKVTSFFQTRYILATVVMCGVVYVSNTLVHTDILKLTVGMISGIIAYTVCLFLMKDRLLLELIAPLSKKLFSPN